MIPDQGKSLTVALVGSWAAGKTSVGPRVADALGISCMDVDRTAERITGTPIHELFAQYGAAGYLRLTEQILAPVLTDPGHTSMVIVYAASAPVSTAHRTLLINRCDVIVHLRASAPEVRSRLRRSVSSFGPHAAHPLLAVSKPYAGLDTLRHLREPYYALADVVIDTTDKTEDLVVQQITEAVVRRILDLNPPGLPFESPFDMVYKRSNRSMYYTQASSTVISLCRQMTGRRLRALDIGCGDGRNAFALACYGFDVDAVDMSRVAVKKVARLRREHGLVRLHEMRGDVATWPIPVEEYDVVVATTILDHVPRSVSADLAQRLVAALRDGGYLYATVFTVADPGAAVRRKMTYNRRTFVHNVEDVSETGWLVDHYYEAEELRSSFANLRIVSYAEEMTRDASHGPPHLHCMAKLLGRAIGRRASDRKQGC
jgi:tellurite methyltransferase